MGDGVECCAEIEEDEDSDSSLVNGQQLICIKATDTRILKGLKQRGIAEGKIIVPKSYFQQKASKHVFLNSYNNNNNNNNTFNLEAPFKTPKVTLQSI